MKENNIMTIIVIFSILFIVSLILVCGTITEINREGFRISMDNNTLEAIRITNSRNITYLDSEPCVCECNLTKWMENI